VHQLDFITALGRLLRDADLREAFVTNAAATVGSLGSSEAVRAALLSLEPADLEFQARGLLRKRFDLVRRVLPLTCQSLGAKAWPVFEDYARVCWPSGTLMEARDAEGFCSRLVRSHPEAVSRSESNRVQFAFGHRKAAVHWVGDLVINNRIRSGLQIFLRLNRFAWREHHVYLGF
jgi:hypothetical protein